MQSNISSSSIDTPDDALLPELSGEQIQYLLTDLLKGVSRSFYLTLRVLPSEVRAPISLAYLLARVADTIADTDIIASEQRLEMLLLFRKQLQECVSVSHLEQIQDALSQHQADQFERELLSSLFPLFAMLQQQDSEDRDRVTNVVTTLTRGMEFDLRTFPAEHGGEISVLLDDKVLDNYIYLVAGCVGEFWTDTMAAHSSLFTDHSVKEQSRLGVRFGKALQLTNVVRDVAEDLRIGRCYLPQSDLEPLGLSPEMLLDDVNSQLARPVLVKWVKVALDHFQAAEAYILSTPRRAILLRLSTLWPVVIGLATLEKVATNEHWLDPLQRSKVSRQWIYKMMLLSLVVIPSNRLIKFWIGRFTQRVVRNL